MIIDNGLGDDSLDLSSSTDYLVPIGIFGAFILAIFLTKGSKRESRVSYKVSKGRVSKAKSSSSSLSENQSDVVKALVGQGASKNQARTAVLKAGNGSFDEIFRKASRSLI